MPEKYGHIFWDLAPWIVYQQGYDLGCTIYVANLTDELKEYALIAKLYRDNVLLVESALPVHGHAWFEVAPDDFARLYGSFSFDETDVVLVVSLVDRETEESVDSVSTILIPSSATELPTPWPALPGIGADLSALMMLMMLMMIMSSMFKSKDKKEELPLEEEQEELEATGI